MEIRVKFEVPKEYIRFSPDKKLEYARNCKEIKPYIDVGWSLGGLVYHDNIAILFINP